MGSLGKRYIRTMLSRREIDVQFRHIGRAIVWSLTRSAQKGVLKSLQGVTSAFGGHEFFVGCVYIGERDE